MSGIYRDVRFGFRVLLKRPGFTLLAVLALALGIGANSAVFSLVNAMLLRPLAIEDPERLVGVYSKNLAAPDSYRAFSYPNYADLRDQNGVLSHLAAHNLTLVGVTEGDSTRRAFADIVSSNFFSTLGASLFMGRAFTELEEQPGSDQSVVIVSHSFWRRRGSETGLLGQTIRINGRLYSIVGVTSPEFTGTTALISPDVWLPLGVYEQVINGFEGDVRPLSDRNHHSLFLVGRLKPGLTVERAEAQLALVASRLEQAYPKENQNQTFTASPMPRLSISTAPQDESQLSVVSVLVIAMSSVVLLIACLNLANMMLAQGSARRKEIAIRLAVGGSRVKLVRQLLIEGLILAGMGGVAGLLLSRAAAQLVVTSLQSIAPFTIVFHQGVDWRVLAATTGFAALSTLLFGLWPALKLSRPNLVPELKESVGEDASGGGRGFFTPRNLLVLSQIALSLALLTSAGLFVRGALKAGGLDPGFSLQQLLIEVDPSLIGRDEAEGRQTIRALRERLASLPGVDAASYAATVPFGMLSLGRELIPAEESYDPNDAESRAKAISASINLVDPDYFTAMGIPLIRGRLFTRADDEAGAPRVVIVDEALSERLWPGENPVGRRIRFTREFAANSGRPDSERSSSQLEVVGVVATIKDSLFLRGDRSYVYAPAGAEYHANAQFHLRSSGPGPNPSLAAAVRREVSSIDSALPILSIKTMRDHLDASFEFWVVKTGARLFGALAAVALLLAVVGLYAVRAYTVARRTREIGIRIALGATPARALRLILRDGLILSLVGVGFGLALSALVGQMISSFLYQVSGSDLATYLGATFILLLVSLLACYVPARRAARVDPLRALRCE